LAGIRVRTERREDNQDACQDETHRPLKQGEFAYSI
jgi:hypothetical protein